MSVNFRMLALLCVALCAGPVLGVQGCARRAFAAEVEGDGSVTDVDLLEVVGEVNQLSGEVSALTGTVSGQVQGITDSLAVTSTKVDGVSQTQVEQGEKLDAITSGVGSTSHKVEEIASNVESQSESISGIDDKAAETLELVKAMSEPEQESTEVQAMELDDLLALVPEGASAEIMQYVQHPFLWGMAAGIFGWLISLAIGAVYRLLGFH